MNNINKELYDRLVFLGIIPNEVRAKNIGASNYSEHTIQPYSIWIDWDLNPWDADIVKRVLRTKKECGMSFNKSRKMDYEKIIHICQERIRQINVEERISKKKDWSNANDEKLLCIESYHEDCGDRLDEYFTEHFYYNVTKNGFIIANNGKMIHVNNIDLSKHFKSTKQ